MPKQVDHQQRRGQIAAAVARIATTRGLSGVSFRDVAAEAGVSVSLIQHYFGAKERLLVDSLDIQSARIGEVIVGRLEHLGPGAAHVQRVREAAAAFLPDSEESRLAMLLYLGFAGAALTDPDLRRADAFRNGRSLLDFLAAEMRRAVKAGELAEGVEPEVQALAILSLVLGLSLAVLLEQSTIGQATEALDALLSLLKGGLSRD